MANPFILGMATLALVGALGLAMPAEAQIFPVEPAFPNTPSSFRYVFSCYDDRTLELLNCKITLTVIGNTDDGGHKEHPGVRPLFGSAPDELICLNCVDGNPGNKVLETFTQNDVVVILYPLPEVAGGIQVEGTIAPPITHFCISNCDLLTILDVRIPNLVELPQRSAQDNDVYVTVRALTATHPQGHFATQESRDTLLEIAEEYKRRRADAVNPDGLPLSINDLSLPKGGLFDFNATWAPPHTTHRSGTDADINRASIDGVFVDCNVDFDLQRAVLTVAQRKPGVILSCEDKQRRPDLNGRSCQ